MLSLDSSELYLDLLSAILGAYIFLFIVKDLNKKIFKINYLIANLSDIVSDCDDYDDLVVIDLFLDYLYRIKNSYLELSKGGVK